MQATDDPTRDTSHRPWPIPTRPWIMAQRWSDLLFAHWPVDPHVMRTVIPTELPLDLYDGSAWLTIAPFKLTNLRPRCLPALPWLSDFLELNVRTYVTLDDRPGVFFFSLDASKLLPVVGARLGYALPYHLASMSARDGAGTTHYESRRLDPAARTTVFSAEYAPDGPARPAEPGSLDYWLSERYCLYAVRAHRVLRAEIHHARWPLQPARAEIKRNTMAAAVPLALPSVPPRVAFARQLDVVVWTPERVR